MPPTNSPPARDEWMEAVLIVHPNVKQALYHIAKIMDMKEDIISMVAEFDQFEVKNSSCMTPELRTQWNPKAWTRDIRKLWAKLECHVASKKKKIRDCHPAFRSLLQTRFDKPMEDFEQLTECIDDSCDMVGSICECDDCKF
ncbi:hypothetical protein N7481_002300 [Penicillium waksmanii]|uniref:uncharacterized protein n=1 Tax=Penicillium waksmanii TaxID=69791 RepID=UPI00254849DB|nr:uncharacterized protein N7481_002300 [Penicillium waksmanii]KAJ5995323.1 hypothetical protein N7481_002300 [Penicillium waksmanii]